MAEEIKSDIEKTLVINSKDRCNAMFYNVFFRKGWMPFYIGIFILFSLVVLVCHFAGLYHMPTPVLLCAGGLLGLLVVFIISIVLTSQGDESERKLIITEQGIVTSAGRDNKMLRFSWQEMYLLGKTRKYFYIYIDASQFIIVPKRFYTSEEIKRIKAYF